MSDKHSASAVTSKHETWNTCQHYEGNRQLCSILNAAMIISFMTISNFMSTPTVLRMTRLSQTHITVIPLTIRPFQLIFECLPSSGKPLPLRAHWSGTVGVGLSSDRQVSYDTRCILQFLSRWCIYLTPISWSTRKSTTRYHWSTPKTKEGYFWKEWLYVIPWQEHPIALHRTVLLFDLTVSIPLYSIDHTNTQYSV